MEVNIESSEDWDLVHQTLPANHPGTMIDVYEQLTQLRRESMKKNSGVYGIRTLDLYDTGAALYQLS